MKLQVAIDRVSFEKAAKLVDEFEGIADVIEIGTSLIKDYGLLKLKDITDEVNKSKILGDIKTSDEGEYEFRQGFEQGFDILTVMGSASFETISKCYEVAEEYNKIMMIDLLECSKEKINDISNFNNAIYCIHTSVDKERAISIGDEIKKFNKEFPKIKNIAVAGGVKIDSIEELKKYGVELVIVGSAITSSNDPKKVLESFKEAISYNESYR